MDDKFKEFVELSEPLIKWLNENHNPHTYIMISPDCATVLSGELNWYTTKFIKD